MRLQFRSCCVVKKICWVCNSRLLNLVFKNPCVVKAHSLSSGHKHLKDLNCCDEHKSLWLHLRPTRLPRGFSCIIAAVIYHPPKLDDRSFQEHLFQSLTLVESKYPNCGILVTGDFNSLDISCLLRQFCLQQIMKEHTRKDTTLDLILTNMHDHYFSPQPFVPLRLSNHNVVVATPLHGKCHLPTSPYRTHPNF